MNPTDVYWDPFDYALHADPHPTWKRMREEAPLYRNERHDFWALTRFQDVLDASLDWKNFSSARGDLLEIIRAPTPPPWYAHSVLSTDPPDQTALRNVLSRSFTPRQIAALEPDIRRFVRELLDAQAGAGGFDYVADFGALLPGRVIAAILGIPDADREIIRTWADSSLHREEDEMDLERYHAVGTEFAQHIQGYIAAQRRQKRGMIGDLLEAEFIDAKGRRRKVSNEEATAFIHLLTVAGNETLAKFVGWAGSLLARFPEERAKLVARPDLIPNAIEEILRYEPPSLALGRYVQRDVTLHGTRVPEGSVLVLITAATGRDQRQFPDPERFDVERKLSRHLSFGVGPHVCMGAPLARLEAKVILEETLARFPTWDVDWDRTEIVHTGSAVRGYAKLPISVRGTA